MPTVALIGNLSVLFFYDDHGLPHFHVVGPDFSAKFLISDGSLISAKGKIRQANLRAVQEWGQKHRQALWSAWNCARRGDPLIRIED